MARSLIQRLLLIALALGLALPVLAKSRPDRVVKETVSLEIGEPMRIAFDGALDTCERWNCFLWVKDDSGELKAKVMIELLGDGQWVAWESAAKEDDEGEGDDDDSADDDDSSDDDDSADAWMELPVISVAERRVKAYEAAKNEFTIEKQRGKLSEDGKWLVVPGDLLPTEDFDLEANGFWGARIGDEEIGSASKTGLVHVKR